LTRVLVTGKISPKVERIYQVVFKANAAGIAAIKPGAVCGDVDAAARKVIEDAGFSKYFGHGLGHGIGMEVHEQPRFSVGSKQILQPGMIVTIEPGIYLPGVGGVRLEDDVLVTKTGHRALSSLGKTWDDARQPWAA
jgi:Xaa-Pro aminopeptidase